MKDEIIKTVIAIESDVKIYICEYCGNSSKYSYEIRECERLCKQENTYNTCEHDPDAFIDDTCLECGYRCLEWC